MDKLINKHTITPLEKRAKELIKAIGSSIFLVCGSSGSFLKDADLVLKMEDYSVSDVTSQAKQLAQRYYSVTGRPLGITGEIAEYEATRLLGVELAPVRQAGYDAIRENGLKRERLQIKGRYLPSGSKSGQRLGGIELKHEWDYVLVVVRPVSE